MFGKCRICAIIRDIKWIDLFLMSIRAQMATQYNMFRKSFTILAHILLPSITVIVLWQKIPVFINQASGEPRRLQYSFSRSYMDD